MHKKILLIIALLVLNKVVFAGALDLAFVQSINNASTSWVNKLTLVAGSFGASIWFIDSLYQIYKKQLYTDAHKLLMFAFHRSLIFGCLSVFFLKYDFYKGITDFFISTGKSLGTVSGGGGGGSTGTTGLNAGWVWSQFSQWYENDYILASDKLGIANIGGQFLLVVFAVIYMIVCLVISFDIIMLNVLLKVILCSGILFAGCITSEWTKPYWKKYIGMLVGVSFEVFVFCLIYSAFSKSMEYRAVTDAIVGKTVGASLIVMIISAAMACLCLHIIPPKLGAAFGGVGGGSIGGQAVEAVTSLVKMIASGGKSMMGGGKPSGGGAPKGTSGQNIGGGGSPSKQAPMNSSNKGKL